MKTDPYAPLDNDERQTMDELEHGEWTSSPEALKRYKEALNQRISINFKAKDLELVKEKAQELGIPYQTLISSVIHRYATGQIKINNSL